MSKFMVDAAVTILASGAGAAFSWFNGAKQRRLYRQYMAERQMLTEEADEWVALADKITRMLVDTPEVRGKFESYVEYLCDFHGRRLAELGLTRDDLLTNLTDELEELLRCAMTDDVDRRFEDLICQYPGVVSRAHRSRIQSLEERSRDYSRIMLARTGIDVDAIEEQFAT